jgi:hypothetical protein
MIKIGDKVYRNLEEQVEYLSQYHDANQGLVQWGIKVVGQVATASKLPVPYDGEYGDAIAVGTKAPFFFYIWTRPSIEGASAYWFPFGEISIVGPEGPKGDKGDRGETGQSTRWYTSVNKPVENDSLYKDGDLCLVVSPNKGDVYRYSAGSVPGYKWMYLLNIMGPQGIQGQQGIQGPKGETGPVGPQGPQGDVGGFINIVDILPSADQLPSPSDLDNLTKAYLIGSSSPLDLYIQIGATSDVANWVNMGPLNVATLVTVGGNYQNIWDADTKVDKVTTVTDKVQVYVKDVAGGQAMLDIDTGTNGRKTVSTIVQRDTRGYIEVPLDPQTIYDAVPKQYVDNHLWKPLNAPARVNIEDTNRRQWRCYYQTFICDLTGKRKTEYTLESLVEITAPAETVNVDAGILSYTLGAKYKAATIGYSALPKESDWSGYWSFNTFTFDEQTDIGSECTLLPFRGSGGFEVKLLVLDEDPVASIIFQKIRAFVTRYEA